MQLRIQEAQKKKNLIRNQKTADEVEDSQTPVLNSLDLQLKFPEGPPKCEHEKLARMIARGFSDRLIRSICGEGLIPEKSENNQGIPRHGYACLDSTLSYGISTARWDYFSSFTKHFAL